jgi:hypothetical protein
VAQETPNPTDAKLILKYVADNRCLFQQMNPGSNAGYILVNWGGKISNLSHGRGDLETGDELISIGGAIVKADARDSSYKVLPGDAHDINPATLGKVSAELENNSDLATVARDYCEERLGISHVNFLTPVQAQKQGEEASSSVPPGYVLLSAVRGACMFTQESDQSRVQYARVHISRKLTDVQTTFGILGDDIVINPNGTNSLGYDGRDPWKDLPIALDQSSERRAIIEDVIRTERLGAVAQVLERACTEALGRGNGDRREERPWNLPPGLDYKHATPV